MKKILNALLILTSLLGYLEWGGGHHAFLGQMEYELLFQRSPETDTFLHPFVIVPLLGQLLLLITLFQKTPGKLLTFIALTSLSLLLVFIFIIGIIGINWKILLSTIPFIWTGISVIRAHRKQKQEKHPASPV